MSTHVVVAVSCDGCWGGGGEGKGERGEGGKEGGREGGREGGHSSLTHFGRNGHKTPIEISRKYLESMFRIKYTKKARKKNDANNMGIEHARR